MALDSNKPVQNVHNGGDGIWEGAAWGLGAGVAATGLMYGATTHGAKHLSKMNMSHAGKAQGRLYEKNARNAAFGKRHLGEGALQMKALGIEQRAGRNAKMLTGMSSAGNFAFGSGKRAMIAGSVGLLGGMFAGAGIDASK